MLNRMEESNKETKDEFSSKLDNRKSELKSEIYETKLELNAANNRLENKLEENNTNLNAKLDETNAKLDENKLELSNKLDETKIELNAKLDEKVDILNNQLKIVVEKVSTIEVRYRCTVMEGKIDERCKMLESTLKKAFTEQFTNMDGTMKKYFAQCETKITEVKSDCERLELVVSANTQHINRLENVVKVNESEVEEYGGKFKSIDEKFEYLRKEFNKRTATTVIYQGQIDDKNRVTFVRKRYENPIEFRDCVRGRWTQ